jgi:hypothetical protein
MKKLIHQIKLDDLGDPLIHSLIRELSTDQGWEPEGKGDFAFFTFMSLWAQTGGCSVTGNNFATPGVWSLRLSQLTNDQLLEVLVSLGGLNGGTLEQYGDPTVLNLLKKIFRPMVTRKRRTKFQRPQIPAMTRVILQRRANGDL